MNPKYLIIFSRIIGSRLSLFTDVKVYQPMKNHIPGRKNDWPAYAVLAAAALALYSKTFWFDFIPSWDDGEYILDNLRIRSFTADNVLFFFTTTFFSNYAPLHLLSYSIDHLVWGLDPRGFHLTNIILHAANSMLAYSVLKRVLPDRGACFIAALLFAAHPINVENVAWVSERKTLLAAFFAFLSLRSYLDFSRDSAAGHFVLSVVFFALSMLSKQIAISMPLLLAAYEMLIGKGLRKKALNILPFIAIAAAGAVIIIYAQMGDNSIDKSTLTFEILFGTVYPTMSTIYWKYAGLIAWPFSLSGFYDTELYNSFFAPAPLGAVLGILALSVFVFLKGGAQTRFWFLWFWIWLVPVSNIIPLPVYYADRYMYLPAIAFFVFAGRFLASLSSSADKIRKTLGYAITAALIALYAATAFMRADVWKDELAFWTDTAVKSPNMYKARLNLGYALEQKGMYEQAEKEYEAAVRIYPDQEAISNLNMVRLKKGSATGEGMPLKPESPD